LTIKENKMISFNEQNLVFLRPTFISIISKVDSYMHIFKSYSDF